MGLTFQIRHLVHPLSKIAHQSIHAREQWYTHRWAVLNQICQIFEWAKPPWEEPGGIDASDDTWISCSWSQYILFLSYANQLNQNGLLPSGAHISHLTDRNDSNYAAIYLPVTFPATKKMQDEMWEVVTIGSSVYMAQILRELEPYCAFPPTPFMQQEASYAESEWHSIHITCTELREYAELSLKQNLPLLALW